MEEEWDNIQNKKVNIKFTNDEFNFRKDLMNLNFTQNKISIPNYKNNIKDQNTN
jgi:hypothetical protein